MIPTCGSNNSVFRPLRGVAARCLLAAVPLAIAPAAHAAYNLTFVADPTGTGVINLLGINNSATIAGFDNGVTNAGFTLTLPANFTVVNYPGAASTQVTGINGAGDLSGFYVDGSGNTHGFTRIGGTFTTVDNPLSTVFNQALGINNSDETVGYYAPTPAGSSKRRRLFAARRHIHRHQPSAAHQLQQSGGGHQQRSYALDRRILPAGRGPRDFARLRRRGRHDHHHRPVRLDIHAGSGRQ